MSDSRGISHPPSSALTNRFDPQINNQEVDSASPLIQILDAQSDPIKLAHAAAPNSYTNGQNLPPSIEGRKVVARFVSTEGAKISLPASRVRGGGFLRGHSGVQVKSREGRIIQRAIIS